MIFNPRPFPETSQAQARFSREADDFQEQPSSTSKKIEPEGAVIFESRRTVALVTVKLHTIHIDNILILEEQVFDLLSMKYGSSGYGRIGMLISEEQGASIEDGNNLEQISTTKDEGREKEGEGEEGGGLSGLLGLVLPIHSIINSYLSTKVNHNIKCR